MKARKNLAHTITLLSLVPAIIVALAFSIINTVKGQELISNKLGAAAHLDIGLVEKFFANSIKSTDMLCEIIRPELFLTASPSARAMPVPDYIFPMYTDTRGFLEQWVAHQTGLTRVSIVDDKNKIVFSSNSSIENTPSSIEAKYLGRIARGEKVVTRLFNDNHNADAPSFIVARPLSDGKNYLGSIMLCYRTEAIQAILANTNVFASGRVQVLDTGNCVVADSNGVPAEGDKEQIELNQILNSHTDPEGQFRYISNHQKRIAYYSRIPDMSWTVLYSAAKHEFLSSPLQYAIYGAILLFVFLAMAFAMRQIVKFRFISPLMHLQNYLRNMNAGDYKSRIPYLGANEFSDIGSAFNNLMTKIEQDNRELTIKEERYRIANEQSNSIIFEYNVETDGFSCSPNACEFANYPAFTHNFPDSLMELQVLHGEDSAQFMRLLAAMRHGRRTGAMELRLRTYRDEFHWFSLLLTTITDTATFKPLRIIGKLTDIDEEKKMTANLTFKAERDPLTGIYNKSTTQSMITQRLSERKQDLYYALIVLDVDDFKHVNDGFGHQRGDLVLTNVASSLADQLHGDDVAGRIGGDEFMVLLSAMQSREAIGIRASHLLDALRDISLDEASGEHITVSMGIALCPQDGISFNQLYASADNALYVRKNAGKDGFSFYREAGTDT